MRRAHPCRRRRGDRGGFRVLDTPHRSPDKSVLRNTAAIYGEYRVSFVVTLRPSGRSFEIEEGASILTTAIEQHSNLPYGSRLGTCCSCRGKEIGRAHV